MTNVDSQRIREIRDNTKAMAEAFSSIANTLAEALELFIATKTETQNSNLTFEKCTMRDCYNCKRYETEGECIECHYEPKDECAKEYEELGLKELKELIEADRKTGPQKKEVEWVYNKRERLWYPYSNGELLFKDEPQTDGYMTAEQTEDYRKMLNKAEHKVYGNIEDEPQTDCPWK